MKCHSFTSNCLLLVVQSLLCQLTTLFTRTCWTVKCSARWFQTNTLAMEPLITTVALDHQLSKTVWLPANTINSERDYRTLTPCDVAAASKITWKWCYIAFLDAREQMFSHVRLNVSHILRINTRSNVVGKSNCK